MDLTRRVFLTVVAAALAARHPRKPRPVPAPSAFPATFPITLA